MGSQVFISPEHGQPAAQAATKDNQMSVAAHLKSKPHVGEGRGRIGADHNKVKNNNQTTV